MEQRTLQFNFVSAKEMLEQHLAAPYQKSRVSLSYYDLAWLLRLENPDNPEAMLFPQYLQQLLDAQSGNGSWGHNPNAAYICDTLLTSLSAVLGLKTWINLDSQIPDVLNKGIEAINRLLKDLDQDAYKSVGFEMLLPALLEEALDHGLPINIPAEIDPIIQQRKRKLAAFPLEMLYSRPTTLLHSLEAFYKIPIDWQRLIPMQDKNGGFLSSPAATAKVYQETGNPKALSYLLELAECELIPVNTPIDIFEINWSLEIIYQLGLASELKESYESGLSFLRQAWTEKGISWSSNFDLPDLDNTSVAFYLLHLAGEGPSAEVFRNFYNEASIYCFYGELESSPTHLLHFLQALSTLPEQVNLRERVLSKLLELFAQNHWRDKWHISPYYTIALSIQPLAEIHRSTVDEMLQYLLENQQEAWGIYQPTLEETAWACYALYQVLDNLAISGKTKTRIETTLQSGILYLQTHYQPEIDIEPLWIDKCLYTPYSIAHTLINAVLLRSQMNRTRS